MIRPWPCEHMLALRIAEHRGISDTIDLRHAKAARPEEATSSSAATVDSAPVEAALSSTASMVGERSEPAAATPTRDNVIRRAWRAIKGDAAPTETVISDPNSHALELAMRRAIAEVSMTIVDVIDEEVLIDELCAAVAGAAPTSRARRAVDALLVSQHVREVFGNTEDLIVRFQGFLTELGSEKNP